MFFTVLAHGGIPPANARARAFLRTDNWDDWFKYNTMYVLLYIDDAGEVHSIGEVKIGQFELEENQRRPEIPKSFDELDERFFSIGQDASYYESLNELGGDIRDRVLAGLMDLALQPELFQKALGEDVTGVSLLRSVTPSTVRGQFHRLARGGARLSRYEFTYTAPQPENTAANPITLSFEVEPESYPPTNIHVLIGRNGVGKTHLLHHMTLALAGADGEGNVGAFGSETEDESGDLFANIVSVTFSAFDSFEPLTEPKNRSKGVRYSYVGLKRRVRDTSGKPLGPKSPSSLSREFGASAWNCRRGARFGRLRRALEVLEADPIFKDAEVAELASEDGDEEVFRDRARELFERLSSGHKIVLLTVTRLVEAVEERTLVLLDEPEAHLHPPLLSAFVRALSDLLVNRNGVAIVATHSPVVLQEVPKACAWKIRRTGSFVEAERPEIETFGENVGVLTREVFGLEVTHSGFHKMLREAVDEEQSFSEVLERFSNQIGGEGRAIVRALLAAQGQDKE